MDTIISLSLLPDALMKHIKASPILRSLFENTRHDRYINMLLKIFSAPSFLELEDIIESHRCYHISKEHGNEWKRCFELAMEETGMDDHAKDELRKKINIVIDGVVKKSPCQMVESIINKYKHNSDISGDLVDLWKYLHHD